MTARGSLNVALCVRLLQLLSLVMKFTSLAQGEFTLGNAALIEEDSQRDQCQPFFFGSAGELGELAAVDQQLARSFRFVVPERRLRILRDIAPDQPQVVPLYASVGFVELTLAVAKAFDFASLQDHAAFERFHDLELVFRLAILGDDARNGFILRSVSARFRFRLRIRLGLFIQGGSVERDYRGGRGSAVATPPLND